MKIIHCADLHLDSAMDSRLPSVKARERRAELRRTFSNLIDYALAGGFDAILICGDLFDEEKVPQPATVANILKMIENARKMRERAGSIYIRPRKTFMSSLAQAGPVSVKRTSQSQAVTSVQARLHGMNCDSIRTSIISSCCTGRSRAESLISR